MSVFSVSPRTALLLLAGSTFPLVSQALTISGYSAAVNDRFEDDPSFIFADFDVTGVARSNDGKWATLVSDNVFLSANHLHPGIGSTVTFFTSNDPAGTSVARTVVSGQRLVAGSDLWVGVLDSPVTEAINAYPYLTLDLANAAAFGTSPLFGATGVMTGKNPGGDGSITDIAFGQNRLDLAADSVEVAGSTDFALVADDDGNAGLSSEAYLLGGDSGAPLFVILSDGVNSQLALAGINWFNGQATFGEGSETFEVPISGFSYVGNYDAELAAYISLHAVPEPATMALCTGLLALGFIRFRRRRKESATEIL
jgi:hypothetical protein